MHRFWPWNRTWRAITVAGETKTPIIIRKNTAAMMWTAAIAREETVAAVKIEATTRNAAVVETVAAVAKNPIVFRKKSIIAVEKETTLVAAKTSRVDSTTNFNRKEKYIWINNNLAAFV